MGAAKKRGPKSKPADPPPLPGFPEPPSGLDTAALVHWRETAKMIAAAGLLSKLDRDALLRYVQAWARLREVQDKVKSMGGTLVKGARGALRLNPYLALEGPAAREVRFWSIQLGLTPLARSRLRVEERDAADDKFAFLDADAG
jgi:P27 family predicted phage terminase small subunit